MCKVLAVLYGFAMSFLLCHLRLDFHPSQVWKLDMLLGRWNILGGLKVELSFNA